LRTVPRGQGLVDRTCHVELIQLSLHFLLLYLTRHFSDISIDVQCTVRLVVTVSKNIYRPVDTYIE